MTPGEEAARAGMERSVHDNREQVAMTDESRVLLADLIEERMSIAVAEGIQAVLTNEDFWAKVLAVLQKQAADRTGRFLLGGLTKAIKNLGWLVLFVLVAYSVGGWSLVKAVWIALTKG